MTDAADLSQRRPRWLYPAFIASLALNLLVIGGRGAAAWHHRHGHGGFGRGFDKGLMGFVRALPADRQQIVRADFEAAREIIRPLRASVQDAFKDSAAALTADPFDRDRLKVSMDRLAEAESRLKTAMGASLGETASKLSADERRLLQGWREKMRPGLGRGGHGDGPGRDKDGGPGEKE